MGRKKIDNKLHKLQIAVYIEANKIAKIGTIAQAKEFIIKKFDEL